MEVECKHHITVWLLAYPSASVRLHACFAVYFPYLSPFFHMLSEKRDQKPYSLPLCHSPTARKTRCPRLGGTAVGFLSGSSASAAAARFAACFVFSNQTYIKACADLFFSHSFMQTSNSDHCTGCGRGLKNILQCRPVKTVQRDFCVCCL